SRSRDAGPRAAFGGDCIGSTGMILFEVQGESAVVRFGDAFLPWPKALLARLPELAGKRLQLGIRPEFVQVSDAPCAGALAAEVIHVEDLGTYKILDFRLGGQAMKARLPEEQAVPHERAWVGFASQWLMLYADDLLVAEQP